MRGCLDEGMLQSYLDGELPAPMMERATLHLRSCVNCAASLREAEQECSLLNMALVSELDTVVPTERLRHRIDAAVAGLHVVRPAAKKNALAAFLDFLGNLITVSPQRTLGYASLVLVLAFAGIFSIVKFRTSEAPVAINNNQPNPDIPQTAGSDSVAAVPSSANIPTSIKEVTPAPSRSRKDTHVASRVVTSRAVPVKLIPGERSYLQTIAKLDTAIKSEKRAMRPALQVEYERNLAVVDRAIAATRNAAKANPNDPDAVDFMFSAYQSKVDLLNTIADARLGGRSQ